MGCERKGRSTRKSTEIYTVHHGTLRDKYQQKKMQNIAKYIKEAIQIHPKSIKNHPRGPPDPPQSTLVPQTSLETSIFDDFHLIVTSLLSPKSHQKSINISALF